jgi:hypothetical protein
MKIRLGSAGLLADCCVDLPVHAELYANRNNALQERHLRTLSMYAVETYFSQLTKIARTTQHFLLVMKSIRMNLHSHWQKEFFDELLVRSPITIIAGTAQRIVRMKTLAPNRYPSWKMILRLCAIGLTGLGIAVAFWGIGHKQSLYYGHAAPSSRIPVARLWSGPKGASSPATSRIRAKFYLNSGSPAFSVPISQPVRLDRAVAYIPPFFRRGIASFDFLIPSRAPPPQRYCLA